MKKTTVALFTALLVLSLAGCSSAPSDEKIKTALEDGTITIEDAKEKGWIDDEWVEANFEPIKAKTKIYLFDSFQTTYLDGTPASSELIEGKMCLVFFNTAKDGTMDKLKVFNDIREEMEDIGVPILGIITDEQLEDAKEKLNDIKFPILVYNEEMQKSLAEFNELIDSDVVSIFTKEGGFYSAWNSGCDSESLLDFARGLADEE
ncbi:hypothetical protein [Lachnoclostridium phytofermentans]|uniref:hypothetical protein n=1 Tax=Lachnoclostridium phytofermentans TaxID=66219 RepID=UPI0002D72DB1|nr:hypothetical protein [Lachnoclostridium phytofermentans]